MQTYRFSLVLTEREDSEDDAEALYSQFDDGSLITSEGVTRIEFARGADSLREAVSSAIDDVERTRFRVARVETPESRVVEEINAELMAPANGRN